MSRLAPELRRKLERTALEARRAAEEGARQALEALAVHESDPYRHMDEPVRALRRRLRAQARQLGDKERAGGRGAYGIDHLTEKLAYDQWHRILFARFLLENQVLISPEHGVSVTLEDCEELAPSLGLRDAWAVAALFAAQELPEIFRADDPAGAVELPAESRQELLRLVTGLAQETFTASDSLGWCYQFWQAERKDQVNEAGNKIGADELPAVTQLFTEDYMVDFLLDNTLGAWHAGKVLAANPKLAEAAQSEDELRQIVALPGCPWRYLRFIKVEGGAWTPAASTFDGWPSTAAGIRVLDPCMGSGHFVVAMFQRLVALRQADESLNEAAAVAAVIRDNVFGLEIDPRCTQIGAFNLALAAWRRVGYCKLPTMNLACSGLAPNSKKEDWLRLAGNNDRLANGMERLYQLFKDAPVLGSLINPRAGEDDLLVATFHELQPLLERALTQESKDDTAHEMAVTAHGLAKAAEILASQFALVATNVPYLGRGKQYDTLKDYCERVHPAAKADLATCFIERSLEFCASGGRTALVTPHSWLFLGAYRRLREHLLRQSGWELIARLGAGAFETISGEVVNVSLSVLSRATPDPSDAIVGLDVSGATSPADKALNLQVSGVFKSEQAAQLQNPDATFIMNGEHAQAKRLSEFVNVYQGVSTTDMFRFVQCFWEQGQVHSAWEALHMSPTGVGVGDCCGLLRWERGKGDLSRIGTACKGLQAYGKNGLAVAVTSSLHRSSFFGNRFDGTLAAIVPHDPANLTAIAACVFSEEFPELVREVDQALSVTESSFGKIRFNLSHWQKVAAEKYPHGLPKPFSSDPTQWLFNGHPAGADQPMHVAVARLLGYQWPRQTGSSFPDCPALGLDGLEKLADGDGIVPINPAKGEGSAAERLRELLALAYGKDWNATRQEELLAQVNYAGASLEDWLRNGVFEQHCALFHHRPFIWQVWDGLKNGFSALVNYHKLTHANLEKLTYTYLGDWIRRQQAAVEVGEAGSDARLEAARTLQEKLRLILEGEPPYDIFVRWKPLSEQSIGWHPDLDDGVRMNIRPFVEAGVLRKRVKIKWDKDRGKEPLRDKKEYPWFWGWDGEPIDFAGVGQEPDGNRWNDCHYTNDFKRRARKAT